MKPRTFTLAVLALLATASPVLAQAPASFKKLTPAQKGQLTDKLKAPGLQIVRELDLPPTFECEQDFRQAIQAFNQAVGACASLDAPAAGSPIDQYNKSTPSQQFNTCKDFPDEFACFNQKLIPEQQRFCENANKPAKDAAERARAKCIAKECAKISIKIKALETGIAATEKEISDAQKKLADQKKNLADAQKDKQQARCN